MIVIIDQIGNAQGKATPLPPKMYSISIESGSCVHAALSNRLCARARGAHGCNGGHLEFSDLPFPPPFPCP